MAKIMPKFVLECIVFKVTHPGTKEKWYVPYVGGKPLRLTWKTKTRAKAYGGLVLDRYLRKKALMKEKQNGVA